MIAMIFATSRWLRRAALLGAVATAISGCQKERPNRGNRTERPLDGMERFAARSVSMETAIDAIEQRDVKKLKMLSVWVRKRDKTALMSADDLKSLDLAIECLEGAKTQAERSVALDQIESGKLKAPARAACIEERD